MEWVEWVAPALLLPALYWLWEIRRSLGLRSRLPVVRQLAPPRRRKNFRGAIPPARYVVVRWPDGHHFYEGCQGAAARQVFEHTHPRVGEEVELWELDNCRGVK